VLRHIGVREHGPWAEARLADGRIALVVPARSWDDYLTLSVTEIREYGSHAIQVLRRLRAVLEGLRDSVRPEFVGSVDDELARLDATVAASFGDSVDHDRAGTADRQGIGGPAGMRG
jgi:uncharacterized membrane protein